MNSKHDMQPVESLLLDYHLDRLDADSAHAVEDAVANSRDLAIQSQALRNVLSLLDRHQPPPPPDDLVDRIMNRVGNRPATIVFPRTAPESPGNAVLSLRELIAIAACIALFIGVFVPGYYKARNTANRSLCRANMAQLFGAVGSYAEANHGSLPSAGYVPQGFWQPIRVPNVPRASNTRHFFLLLREGYIKDPGAFLCPSDADARPMLAADFNYREFSDFGERTNNSYSFIFMNVAAPVRLENFQKEGATEMALISDRNPLFDGRAVHRLNPYEEEKFNSPTHENGAGQNVLYGDGHAAWSTNPLVGVDRDNIYRCGQLVRYLGNEGPSSPTDSFLP